MLGWDGRIERALRNDVNDDKDLSGRTPRLDAMEDCLIRELSVYGNLACIRDVHSNLLRQISQTKIKRAQDIARLREYRETAKHARMNQDRDSLPEDWYDMIQLVPVDMVFASMLTQKRGRRWVCPACGYDDRRRGTVSTSGALWHCFHCKAGGSHLQLLEGMGKSRKEAVNEILSLA